MLTTGGWSDLLNLSAGHGSVNLGLWSWGQTEESFEADFMFVQSVHERFLQ
jgi:hypothetical protein